jgi:C4-dicarboxylate-specific signal transduction histidine kinase
LRREEIAFMGRITAGMTHEIKNVLAIIRESAGLMEDLLSLRPEKPFTHQEKFLKTIATIQEQVNRGVDLTTRLNRFAHSMDEPAVSVDVNDLLEQTGSLLERFARLKRVQLRILPMEQPQSIRTDPFRLQMVLSECVDALLNRLETGGEVSVRPLEGSDRKTLRILIQGATGGISVELPQSGFEHLSAMQGVLDALGASLESSDDPEQKGVILTLSRDNA